MLKHWSIWIAVGWLYASAAQALQMNAVYDLYRNDQKLGTVTETYTRTGKTYRIVSETRATGPLKMLWPGTIRLESEGEVRKTGLRPKRFSHNRSDKPNKTAVATLDWPKQTIHYHYKGETRHEKGLRANTQDQLSQLYQFAFMRRLPKDYSLAVVSGKNANTYRYARRDGGTIDVPAGKFAVQEFSRTLAPGDDKAITVWVAPARKNFPVQVRVVEDGTILEQRLVTLTVKP